MAKPAETGFNEPAAERLPPRERILAVARDLFYERGVRAVGVDEIAEAAGTNKMTLYRHFASKYLLVAECLRQVARQADAELDRLAAAHPGNPRAELTAWLAAMTDHIVADGGRGCALANAAVELAEKDHPARKVIEEVKRAQRDRLVRLCRAAALEEPGSWPTNCSCCSKAPGSAPRASAATAAALSCAWGRSSPRTRRA